jgi:uroporphyrinogen-III decarboxylase
MNRRERLLATLRGEPVDRPAVCFYEINGLTQDEANPDPFNIYSHPSWAPLLELTRTRSDRIVQLGVPLVGAPPAVDWGGSHRTWLENGSRISEQVLQAGGRTLRRRTRRDPDTDTVWTTEHLLKDADDLAAFLSLPEAEPAGEPDIRRFLATETALGDSGLCMVDSADPLCCAASLFDMGDFTIMATTEPELFDRLLQRFARCLRWQVAAVARALPGRLWRIVGPEYATPPYLHPRLFRRLVCAHDAELVAIIRASGGWARIHCHGRIRQVLPDLAALGADAIDPLEPLPQGDVTLAEVGAGDGRGMVLFGNIEASDLENLAPTDFAGKVATALAEGRRAPRGFVLMPSACPYGRVLGATALANYRTMVEMAEAA